MTNLVLGCWHGIIHAGACLVTCQLSLAARWPTRSTLANTQHAGQHAAIYVVRYVEQYGVKSRQEFAVVSPCLTRHILTA
jgi:hypothetical protein